MPAQIDDLEFDGYPIVKRTMKVTGAGDGLSDSMKVNKHHLQGGDVGVMVLRFRVGGAVIKQTSDSAKDGDATPEYERVDNLVALSATIVEGDGEAAVEEALVAHEAQVAELRLAEEEERKGLKRIEFDPAEDEAQASEDGAAPTNGGGLASVPDPE